MIRSVISVIAASALSLSFTSVAAGQGSILVQVPAGTHFSTSQEFTPVGGVGYMLFYQTNGNSPKFCSFSLASGVLLDADGLDFSSPSPAGAGAVVARHNRLVMPAMPLSVIVVDTSHPEDLKLAGVIELPCGVVDAGGIALASDGHTGFTSTVYSCVHSFDIDTMQLLDPDGARTPAGGGMLGLGTRFLAVVQAGGRHVYGFDVSDPTDMKLAWNRDFGDLFNSSSEVEVADDGRTAFVQGTSGRVYSFDLETGRLLQPGGLLLGTSAGSWLDRHRNVLAFSAGGPVHFVDVSDPAHMQLIASSPPLYSVAHSLFRTTAFSKDGSRFAAASVLPPEKLYIVSVQTGNVLGNPIGIGQYPTQVVVFGDDQRISVVCQADDSVHLIWGMLAPIEPVEWCLPKINSQGCAPTMNYRGSPSASSLQPFDVIGTNILNQKFGMLLYGLAPRFTPFQGGSLCIAAPYGHVGLQESGGNPAPSDCSGRLSFDFNAFIRSGSDPALVQGTFVYAQYWYRDVDLSDGSGLTDALQFLIGP